MNSILRVLCSAVLVSAFPAFASAATMTMAGMISDSECGVSHAKMTGGHTAGDKVSLTGDVKGTTITVAKVMMGKK